MKPACLPPPLDKVMRYMSNELANEQEADEHSSLERNVTLPWCLKSFMVSSDV
eukprot:CAMPEP_0201972938 /NCGR_PEP_ID=MMETSP0904-20121228/43971_1 /ASSEMBLY_ACC=CAM_ASM_000553 /TAXON_ID=420261 /ORGANISM="Thalassiosira antarctica, Strain CCMP982" /LENGTH=52 /DNA_ID=CAMNT_0048522943 /DNA_START=312 /DNA_END=470 /DNA_ORIENTATION=+